eukprot:3247742-Prymnesium_polylepis.1
MALGSAASIVNVCSIMLLSLITDSTMVDGCTCCPPATADGTLPGGSFSASKARPVQKPQPGQMVGRMLPRGA